MWRTRLRSEHAQGMLEFALIAPVVVFIFLGIVDFSRFLYYDQVIVSAARNGAEMAINHCTSHSSCGMTDTPVGDDYVVQAAYCSATPDVHLRPQAATCASCLTVNCASTTPVCNNDCLEEVCQQDICATPAAGHRANGTDVTVSVGYDFQPITPLIGSFFPTKACWTGDPSSNHHTLCAASTGSVY